MSKLDCKKKRIFSIAFAAVLLVAGFKTQGLLAAERVDTDATVKITAAIDREDTSVFATNYNGEVEVDLYKIAELDSTGNASLTEAFSQGDINLELLKDNPSVEDVKTGVVEPAMAIAEGKEADATISFNKADGATSGDVSIQKGAGLYLYIPREAKDDRFIYSFTPYVIFAPGSEYIRTGSGSDAWQYDVTFNLKASEELRYGSLIIKKTLDKYNASLGEASFVYKVVGTTEDGGQTYTVFDNVYALNFTSAGEKTIEIIDEIPATINVTVTEVYSGASYDVVGESVVDGIVISAEEIAEAAFTNTGNDKLITGGIAAENQFVEEEGVVYWIDEEGEEHPQTSIWR